MGLAGVISNLLSLGTKLLPAVCQNNKIETELEKLMRMLQRIKSTLYDAEQREITDFSVKLWLKELKRVAYDAEDVLDEYDYELLQARVEARDASPPISHKRKLIQDPDDMLDQIQDIRSRFDEITNDRIALQLSEGDGPKHCNNELQLAPTSHIVVQSNIFGRDREKEKLINLLSSESDVVSVVTIVGMGGIGKTTLAQLVYKDQRIQQRFDKFVWICVSNDFNVERLTKELVESITSKECLITNLSVLKEIARQRISGKRVFLVLDDVWNEKRSLWESFQAPFMSATFAQILVTTRNDHVAQIMQTMPTFNLGDLSAKQCWQLFEHFAFGGVEGNKCPKLVEIGKQIMNKCGMLPLAVKSIACLLRQEAKEESWREILESELWELKDVRNEIFPPLQISYVRLPTYLKSCFLYCCMFPKDYCYDVEYLGKLWMYQGFIESEKCKTAEKIGFEYAKQLCQRSLFERVDWYEGNNVVFQKFKLHDIVHDLARFYSENSCYSIEVSKLPSFRNGLYHLYITNGVKLVVPISFDKFTALRTLIISCSFTNYVSTTHLLVASKLRALEIWVPFDCELESLSSSIGNLKHLRYLSLGGMLFKTLPKCICSLYNLQNLTLTDSHLKELPTKIENLINLEELIIKSCAELKVLPESLCQLKSLRKLFIRGTQKIKELPNNIGNLVSLEELRIEYCHGIQVLPGSLCQLKVLRKLFISGCENIKELPNNIGNLVCLDELGTESCHGIQVLPGSLCQLKVLRKLNLNYCNLLNELPSDMGSLTNLQTLEIRNIGVSHLPPSLSKFVGIQALKVELNCETIGWLKDFPDMGGTLCLSRLNNIPNIRDVQCSNLVSMRNLEHLILSWDDNGYLGTDDVDRKFWEQDGSVFELFIKRGQKILLVDQSCYWVMGSLQPHRNLTKLEIDHYSGILFPEWIGSLCKLKYLKITSCDRLQFLKEESFPLQLEEFKISECHQLVSMPGIQKLKSLVKLSITYCDNLCSCMGPSLELTMLGLTNLVSLKSLKISDCLKLQVLVDELPPVEHCKVEVSNCPGLWDWCFQHGINYKGVLIEEVVQGT